MNELNEIEQSVAKTVGEIAPVLASFGVTLPTKAEAEKEAAEIATTWAVTFAGTFAVIAKPALHAANLGTARAIVTAGAVAGAAAAGRAVKPLVSKALANMKSRKAPAPTA